MSDNDPGPLCCGVVFVLPVVLLICGAVLRGGCALYNRFVGTGSHERIPEPGLGRSMGIVFVHLLASAVAGFVVTGVLGATLGVSGRLDAKNLELLIRLQAFPLGLVILGGLLAVLLPTTFARGLLATMCTLLLVAFIVLIVALLIGALAVLVHLAR